MGLLQRRYEFYERQRVSRPPQSQSGLCGRGIIRCDRCDVRADIPCRILRFTLFFLLKAVKLFFGVIRHHTRLATHLARADLALRCETLQRADAYAEVLGGFLFVHGRGLYHGWGKLRQGYVKGARHTLDAPLRKPAPYRRHPSLPKPALQLSTIAKPRILGRAFLPCAETGML